MATCPTCNAEYAEGEEHTCATPAPAAPADDSAAPADDTATEASKEEAPAEEPEAPAATEEPAA